jgi:hypothetical protein
LNYAMYLHYKAHGLHSSIPARERCECLAKALANAAQLNPCRVQKFLPLCRW